MTTLIENGYTIALFDQKTTNGVDIERVLVGVFSPEPICLTNNYLTQTI